MAQNSILSSKSIDFAARAVALYDELVLHREYIPAKQFLRSGTSIGANVHEAQCAESTADFISKLSIAYKEASETSYWIEVLGRSGRISPETHTSFQEDVRELIRILAATLKTLRTKLAGNPTKHK